LSLSPFSPPSSHLATTSFQWKTIKAKGLATLLLFGLLGIIHSSFLNQFLLKSNHRFSSDKIKFEKMKKKEDKKSDRKKAK